jgi:4-hydroxy-tetrahydrodipicolinate synthase
MAGRWTAALDKQDQLIRLHKALFLDASPAPTKFALAHLGLCTEDVRLPVTPCAEAVRPAILAAMHAAGVDVPAGPRVASAT